MDIDIDTRTAHLSPTLLARFAGGLRWYQLVTTSYGRLPEWWRSVVIQAEDDGLLAWDRKLKTWSLTDAGRELVRKGAKGAA